MVQIDMVKAARKLLYVYPMNLHPGPGALSYGGENVRSIEIANQNIHFTKDPKLKSPSKGVDEWEVPQVDNHWWIVVSGNWWEENGSSLRHTEGMADLVTCLNLCVDDIVTFSNECVISHPFWQRDDGQTEQIKDRIFNAIAAPRPPETIQVSDDLPNIFEMVDELMHSLRDERSPESLDLYTALSLYHTALFPNATPEMRIANLWFACENAVGAGYQSHESTKEAIQKSGGGFSEDDADAWYEYVKRIKHPDEGTQFLGDILEENEIPGLSAMRSITNQTLIDSLEKWRDR